MEFLPADLVLNIVMLGLLFLILLGFVVLLTFIYKFLTNWLEYLQKEKTAGTEQIRHEAQQEAQNILESANKEATQIISDTGKKASDILEEMEGMSEESKQKLSDTLSKTSANLLKIYETNIKKQKSESLQALANLTENIDKSLSKEVGEFEKLLREETVESKEKIREKLLKKYEKLDNELQDYKSRRMKELDSSLYDILYNVTEEVLGKGLNMDEHRKLILESLDDAKKRDLFGNSG